MAHLKRILAGAGAAGLGTLCQCLLVNLDQLDHVGGPDASNFDAAGVDAAGDEGVTDESSDGSISDGSMLETGVGPDEVDEPYDGGMLGSPPSDEGELAVVEASGDVAADRMAEGGDAAVPPDATSDTGDSGDSAADAPADHRVDAGSDGSVDASRDAPVDAPPDSGSLAVGLVALYTFDEASGTTSADQSGNGHAATLIGGANFTTSGLSADSGNALTLSAIGQYASLPSGIGAGLTAFSVATWIYVNAQQINSRIFDFGTGTTNYMFLTPNTEQGVTLRVFGISAAGVGGEQQIMASSLATGSWQHIAVTLSPPLGVCYVNGMVAGMSPNITLTPSSLGVTTQNWLGRSQFVGDPYFSGKFDNFRIYSRALTAAEINQLAQSKL